MKKRQTWGVVLFLLAAAMAILAHLLWPRIPELLDDDRARTLLTYGAVGIAIVAGVLSHISYPRVHSLRVTMYGYGVGVTIILYSLIAATGTASEGMVHAAGFVSYAVLLLLTIVVILIPSFVSYRATMAVSELTVAVVGLIFMGLLVPQELRFQMASRLQSLQGPAGVEFYGFAAASLAGAVLSVLLERESFGLGGMHSGALVILAGGWLSREQDATRHILILFALGTYLAITILAHWLLRVENRVSYDPLLRIYNRSYCDQILDGRTRMNTRPPFSIVMIDIDHFKKVNDTYGHEAGDTVLVEVAQRLQKAVIPQGTIARYGGEELIVFFPNGEPDQVKAIIEGARLGIENEPVSYRGKTISVTVSAGIATRDEQERKLPELMRAADRALYAAKKGGRNQVRVAGKRARRAKPATR